MRIHHFFILILLIFGCSANQEQENTPQEQIEDSSFDDYLSQIPNEKLPFEFDCATPFLKVDISTKESEQYIPEGGSIFRKIQTDSKHTLVLYTFANDAVNPVLYSYRPNGQVIDSLWMYNGSCNGDPWVVSSCYTIVNNDLSIKMNDTIEHYFFNDTIRKLDSTTLETEFYKITDDGGFQFVSKKTVLLGIEN